MVLSVVRGAIDGRFWLRTERLGRKSGTRGVWRRV